ncbi:MAG: hypothetical protein SVW02_02410 [Candidatus Nanohaloarchaea archaeon]|nr:hypothetical protein [Candidatus Nanohaloarchaea archaeon]
MTDVLDPTTAYLLLFIILVFAGLGIGYTAGGQLGLIGSAIFAGVLGFAAGLYTTRETTDIFGSLLLTGGFAAVIGIFLPLTVTWSVAVFLVGFILGMRNERR